MLDLTSYDDRFFSQVEQTESCWLWTGRISPDGYAHFSVGPRGAVEHNLAHRFSYARFIGPIPDGHQIDHICHTNDPACPGGPACLHRRCVRPTDLEPVVQAENIRRGLLAVVKGSTKTHCLRGHAFTPENTHTSLRPNGSVKRSCRACNALRARLRWASSARS